MKTRKKEKKVTLHIQAWDEDDLVVSDENNKFIGRWIFTKKEDKKPQPETGDGEGSGQGSDEKENKPDSNNTNPDKKKDEDKKDKPSDEGKKH